MNKTFGDFFSPFFSLDQLPEALTQGVLETLEIDPVNRCVAATVAFPSLVEREALYDAEKRVAMARACSLRGPVCIRNFRPNRFVPGICPALFSR